MESKSAKKKLIKPQNISEPQTKPGSQGSYQCRIQPEKLAVHERIKQFGVNKDNFKIIKDKEAFTNNQQLDKREEDFGLVTGHFF